MLMWTVYSTRERAEGGGVLPYLIECWRNNMEILCIVCIMKSTHGSGPTVTDGGDSIDVLVKRNYSTQP